MTDERQLAAALAALGIEAPPNLHQAHSDDPALRRAALWALLWRSAGTGLAEATAGTGHDYGYLVSPHAWPLPEDHAQRALDEIEFAGDRLEVLAGTVPPWSIVVETGDGEADGWATPAKALLRAAEALLAPLAYRHPLSIEHSLNIARHRIACAEAAMKQITQAQAPKEEA